MKVKKVIYVTLIIALAAFAGCATSEDVFGDIGENISSPSAMAIDVASARMYLVNSNSRVLYDWHQGNFQVLDITDPVSPVLLKSVGTDSFSGEIYLDLDNLTAYVPNRYTENSQVQNDRMYSFSLDESSPDNFLGYSASVLGQDSYAIKCCYPDNVAWVTTSVNELQYVNLAGDMTPGSLSLTTELDDGASITYVESYHLVLRDNQAIVARDSGGIMFVNLDDAGVDGAVPVDYFISDVFQPRGMARSGDILYALGVGTESDEWTYYLAIIDISSLTPRTDNANTERLDKNDDGLLRALIQVGNNPREVALSTDYAFVTNMNDNTVSVIVLASGEKVADIAVGQEPFSLAIYTTADGVDQYLYVGNLESNTISIIDIPTLGVVSTYP